MGTLSKDVRYALRTLLRAPGFTALVVCTLALGIGANAAVFSVVDAVLLEDLPYREPDRLVTVSANVAGPEAGSPVGIDLALFHDVRDEAGLFSAVAVWRPWTPTLTGRDDPEVIQAADVSQEMFSGVLGVHPTLGRDFVPADDVVGAPGVILLGHATWVDRFGSDPEIVGRAVSLSGMPYVVVGVLPAGFRPPFAPEAELWRALGTSPAAGCERGCQALKGIGRLARGVTLPQARAHGAVLAARLAESYPETNTGVGLAFVGLREALTRDRAPALWTLFGAVAFVLLIACTNVAGLLLVRGATREEELALRLALGAERWSIMAQLLTESLVLAGLGGLAGLGLAAWGTDLLLAVAPAGAVPPPGSVEVNDKVLLFTVALSAATGVLFGLWPAWRATRGEFRPGLATSVHASGRVAPRKGGLAVAQVALALVLCVGAGLLLRSFERLNALDLGFEPAGVLAVDLTLPTRGYASGARPRVFYPAFLARVRALPRVRAAGILDAVPLRGDGSDAEARIEGASTDPGHAFPVSVRAASEGAFEALGVEILAGRGFAATDDLGSARVAVINQTLARRFFPAGDAVGRRISLGPPERPEWRRIVGVVHDVRQRGVRAPVSPALYLPVMQAPVWSLGVVLKTEGEPEALAADVRALVAELDPTLAPTRMGGLTAVVQAQLAPDRFAATVLGSFALAALLLSAVGVYGTVSQRVVRRTREVGVRLALGADAPEVRWDVVRGALGIAAVGMVVGLAAALALGRVVAGFLFEVEPYDPLTFATSVGVLATVAVAAAWLPARRAGRTDAARALRP